MQDKGPGPLSLLLLYFCTLALIPSTVPGTFVPANLFVIVRLKVFLSE